jgi:putative membrane protein
MKNSKTAIVLLCIIYTVGIIGIMVPATRELTLSLTPINLLVSLMVLILYHEKPTLTGFFSLFFIGLFGYILEVAGVSSQSIFGSYKYGNTLGYQIWDVPLTMAINWIIPIYCTRLIAEKASKNVLIVSFLGALMMTGFDFILEPVAVFMDMWSWKMNKIPIDNYIVWFVASFIIHWVYQLMGKKVKNNIAIPLFIIQLVFFGMLSIYLLLT